MPSGRADTDQIISDIGNEFLFTGRKLDPETGLYQYRHRYYHAQLGRFVNRDPIGYRGGMNLYAYVGGRPTRRLDPYGLKPGQKECTVVLYDDADKGGPGMASSIQFGCAAMGLARNCVQDGPFSVFGEDVESVMNADNWNGVHCCMASKGDIIVFYDKQGNILHSGIIEQTCASSGCVHEQCATLSSKWGNGALQTTTWEATAIAYGSYSCFTKGPSPHGCCSCAPPNQR